MRHRYIQNEVKLTYVQEKCIGCQRCAEVCPHGVFRVTDKIAEVVYRERCMECGACAKNCVSGAIVVKQGVGCAAAIINGWLTGGDPNCDCGGGSDCC